MIHQAPYSSWILFIVLLLSTAVAVAAYRRIQPKVHQPRLHVVSSVSVQQLGYNIMPFAYVLHCGTIYRKGEIVEVMREGDSVVIADQGVLLRLQDGRLQYRRTFNKEIHVRVDSSTGDRYMLVGGKWLLLHMYEGDNSWNRLNIGLRTSYN